MLQGLYAIADVQHTGAHDFLDSVESVLLAGVRIIQYRDKINDPAERARIARQLRLATSRHASLLLINDDVELARVVDADGVHLGKNDLEVSKARTLLGADKMIGISCYNHYENAVQAVAKGATYIAFGSFFASPSKPSAPRAELELITRAKRDLEVPVCAIGGITPDNMVPLLHAGADMIAVISGIFSAPSPGQSAQHYLALMQPFYAAS